MSKRIWMPLYISDYLSDTSHLTTLQHGAYLLLIMHYWVKGSLPENEDAIRRITRMDNRQWASNRDDLSYLFSTGWRHKRIDIELGKAIEKSKVNSANAHKSHSVRIPPALRTHTQSQSQLEEGKIPSPSGDGVVVTLEDPKKHFYDRGKSILGERFYGPICTDLLKAKNGVMPQAMSALEGSRGMTDPKAYLRKIISNAKREARDDQEVVWR